jgi:hypothetical protein
MEAIREQFCHLGLNDPRLAGRCLREQMMANMGAKPKVERIQPLERFGERDAEGRGKNIAFISQWVQKVVCGDAFSIKTINSRTIFIVYSLLILQKTK